MWSPRCLIVPLKCYPNDFKTKNWVGNVLEISTKLQHVSTPSYWSWWGQYHLHMCWHLSLYVLTPSKQHLSVCHMCRHLSVHVSIPSKLLFGVCGICRHYQRSREFLLQGAIIFIPTLCQTPIVDNTDHLAKSNMLE